MEDAGAWASALLFGSSAGSRGNGVTARSCEVAVLTNAPPLMPAGLLLAEATAAGPRCPVPAEDVERQTLGTAPVVSVRNDGDGGAGGRVVWQRRMLLLSSEGGAGTGVGEAASTCSLLLPTSGAAAWSSDGSFVDSGAGGGGAIDGGGAAAEGSALRLLARGEGVGGLLVSGEETRGVVPQPPAPAPSCVRVSAAK